jgi:hypothetical protein
MTTDICRSSAPGDTFGGLRDRRLVDDILRMTEKQYTNRIVPMEIARYSPRIDGARIDTPRSELDQRSEALFLALFRFAVNYPNVFGISTSRQSSSPFVIEHQPSEDACRVPTRFQRGAPGSDTSEALSDMAGAPTLSYFRAYRSAHFSAGLNDAPMHAFLRSISTKASCEVFREGSKAHRRTSPLNHALSHLSPKLLFLKTVCGEDSLHLPMHVSEPLH